jgi:mono/diheme cytochrome c family protein
MSILRITLLAGLTSLAANSASAQATDELVATGEALYFQQVSCWVCHGDDASGRVGPSIQYGPTPAQIQEQLDSNPQMAVIVSELDPDADDLVALSTYLSSLGGTSISDQQRDDWRTELAAYIEATEDNTEYLITERDRLILDIMSFDSVLADWQKRSKDGPLKREYESRIVATYDAGEQVFFPEPGKVYFYENTGVSASIGVTVEEPIRTNQVVVGDAETHEVIVSKLIPEEMRGAMHTTVLSPDGRYVYMVGPPVRGGGGGPEGGGAPAGLRGSASLLKIDALTLQPVKQVTVGGRLHHAQIFQDRYLLMDTFVAEPDGLNVFLYDPEIDEVVGGVNAKDLGGLNYTAFTDNEFIYILMMPPPIEGFARDGAHDLIVGSATALRPYWVAKLDPETWEVVDEYPHQGYRGDWIVIDSASEHMYVPTASSAVSKISLATGETLWSSPTGVGPYAATLNADETELWITNKGESSGQMGRTITVVDANNGRGLATLFSGYKSDHVLLAPNGKEVWASSMGDGSLYVFDAESRDQIEVIAMPNHGEPHGLVWVKYDEAGNSLVVRDQGGFHNGINPAAGVPLLD